LGMGIPDFWIKYLKEKSDDDWNIEELWSVMTNRRYKEGTIAYAESHDQAIVGDKTTAFWLMDKEMYWHMHKDDDHLVIDRGVALHKLIRMFTGALGGEGYLTFIGNEFGHPEWIDFPREGNDWSYKYARRQWSLVDHPELKYQYLNNWDGGMVTLLKEHDIPSSYQAQKLNMDATNKTIVAERGNLIFIWNFHPSNAIPDYKFYVPQAGQYRIILNSDAPQFGGHNRIDESQVFETFEEDGVNKLSVYNT
ncbi:MAG TPA: 1,4-alpha-glucan-branching enzyme, partial [Cytophagales bacterium]|nr:1,4-alpha-glucan-branching enzyme [Cytophagales bacterium]